MRKHENIELLPRNEKFALLAEIVIFNFFLNMKQVMPCART